MQYVKEAAEKQGLDIPMMCASPDFTHPSASFRTQEIVKMKQMIDVMASDRYLKEGYTLEDLKEYSLQGYSEALAHGVIGNGMNDYNSIFKELQSVCFRGWISIEDGVNSLGDLHKSVIFLREKVAEYLT